MSDGTPGSEGDKGEGQAPRPVSKLGHDVKPSKVVAHIYGPDELASIAALAHVREREKNLAENAEAERQRNHWLDFELLSTQQPPERLWFIQEWLGPWPVLCAGIGGAGKTSIAQVAATHLALGLDYLGKVQAPLRVALIGCEDAHDELWSRQDDICRHYDIPMAKLKGRFHLTSRVGLRNEILEMVRGELVPGTLYFQLAEDIERHQLDVVFLDNTAHFGIEENDRRQVTRLVNEVVGLWRGRPGCPVFLHPIAKAIGSEYAGSSAWENAVRMRWYLGSRPPGERQEEPEPNDKVRYLCKRKANYSDKDIRRLDWNDQTRIFVLDPPVDGLAAHLRRKQAERVVCEGLGTLHARNIWPTSTPQGKYLPKELIAYKLNEDVRKEALAEAMRACILDGRMSIEPRLDEHRNKRDALRLKDDTGGGWIAT